MSLFFSQEKKEKQLYCSFLMKKHHLNEDTNYGHKDKILIPERREKNLINNNNKKKVLHFQLNIFKTKF